MSRTLFSLAGFQVILIGRFWVIAEAGSLAGLCFYRETRVGKLVFGGLYVTLDLPPSLDHLILGASDLSRGIQFIEQRTGVRAAFGGVHPGRGTHNALLSLGPRCYLEILAPDPEQQTLAWFRTLPELTEPRLMGWMVHPNNLAPLAERLREADIACDGPIESSRQRPNGRTLRWKLLRLADDRQGLLPILIEWNADSPHPADDSPSGLSLVRFEVSTPHLAGKRRQNG